MTNNEFRDTILRNVFLNCFFQSRENLCACFPVTNEQETLAILDELIALSRKSA